VISIVESELRPREREVAKLLLQGLPDREIAARLGIRLRTVKDRLTGMYRRYEIRGGIRRVKLAVLLYRNGVDATAYD